MVDTNSRDTPAPDTPASPIAQLLKHLGMTRGDLERHSSHMRDFLTAENANFSRVLDHSLSEDTNNRTPSIPPSRSRASSFANASSPPPLPHTPIKSESVDAYAPHRVGSMDAVIERKSRLNRKEKRLRKGKGVPMPPSPSPSHSADKGDNPVQSRVFPRAVTSEQCLSSYQTAQQTVTYYPYPYHEIGYKYDHGQSQHSTTSSGHYAPPLPPSSPPPSSPQRSSSPSFANVVSSPGLDDEDPPYAIPPGPYPDEKPELSYAALIGQAILSSKDHRLSLQHIYEWISIVYPYFKRSDQTWMNSIRHVLSTTPVFRKVSREARKSRWAILDKDLPCFANGGFDRKLCADMNRRKLKLGPSKRSAEYATGPAAKRLKQESPTLTRPPHSQPVFPHIHSNPHLQPYYTSYLPRHFPTDSLVQPLPPTFTPTSTALVSQPELIDAVTPSKSPVPPTSSASSLPYLTPSFSSSSPFLSRDTSLQSTDIEDIPTIHVADSNEVDATTMDALEPSVTLLNKEVRNKNSEGIRCQDKARTEKRATTPPLHQNYTRDSFPRPCTPPRKPITSTLHTSPTLTPISHKGLNMSPSASLIHYKTNLDPPPIVTCFTGHDLELTRTPSRKFSSSQYHHPITPRKLSFQFAGDSPFRSPSKSVFDPHDPGTLLEEELKRFGDEDKFSSPAGLFGRNKGLLYESPGVPSPSKWSYW